MNERTISLLGESFIEKARTTSILLVGLGGVGGYAFEALVRSGFKNITIVDFDVFEESNLNRQILALQSTIGKSKCEVAKERAHSICDDLNIKIIDKKLQKEDITEDFLKPFDYVLDACDTVEVKISLIELCSKYSKKIISCMGTANRIHPENLTLTTLDKTSSDPLAKKIRTSVLKDKRVLKTPVVWSSEISLQKYPLGTVSMVPMSAGSLLASYVVQTLKKEEN